MTVLAVDADLHPDCMGKVQRAVLSLPEGGAVLIMVHGYRYSPASPDSDPHRSLYALDPAITGPRILSWPRHMGLRGDPATRTLAIGFGWDGKGTLWSARRAAARAGTSLAVLADHVRSLRGDVRIGILAHSLGARVALSAIAAMGEMVQPRAVLMAPSESRRTARLALNTLGGRGASIVSVSSRENLVFDLLTEIAGVAAPLTALGRGFGEVRANWIDLRIDDDHHRRGLDRLGFRLAPPSRRICHWSAFLRPGVFAIYRALLTDPYPLPLSALREALSAPAAILDPDVCGGDWGWT